MVTALNSMERVGLVKRVQNENDRRKINVFLTERGRRLKSKLWPVAAEILEIGLSGLTRKQIQELRTMLVHISRNLEGDEKAATRSLMRA
jgi:DNA-binding MarR family transcriptional regulator